MGAILGILSIPILIILYIKLQRDFYNKKLRTSFIIFTILFIVFVPVIPILVFLPYLIYTIILTVKDANNRHKTKLIFCILAFSLSIIILPFAFVDSSSNDSSNQSNSKIESKTLTKKQIDKLSDIELFDYVADIDDKGRKLYKSNKNLYKYAFKKYTGKNYDSIEIPNEDSILTGQVKLSREQEYKLSVENPDLYSSYLISQLKDDNKSEQNITNNTSDDTETLEKAIKSELSHGTIESVVYNNDSLGKNAVIVIKGEENLIDKMTADGMRKAVAQAVKAVKESGVDIDTFTIDITYPVEDNEGHINDKFHVIKSQWSMSNVKSLSSNQMELLNTELDTHADSYNESTALK